ncbi:MAG: antibiotic biosynthesis monooxygenase [Magnetococcales bacterium]|nr:antibiotic biosynthesis monooxygenase [Magnetococcales bacterium]
MYVVMNRFAVAPDQWDAFEERFRNRAGLVDGEQGFIRNMVLRPESEEGRFVVMTLWQDRDAFEAWTRSDAFRKAHARAGSVPEGMFTAPNQFESYQVVSDTE